MEEDAQLMNPGLTEVKNSDLIQKLKYEWDHDYANCKTNVP